MKRWLTALVATMIVLATLVFPTKAFAEPTCAASMDIPHYSSGAGGVIAKGRFRCDGSGSETYYNVSLTMWVGCSSLPPLDPRGKSRSSYGCSTSITTYHGVVGVGAGSLETRYVPKSGAMGRRLGYWRAWVKYSYSWTGTQYVKSSPYKWNP